MKDFKSRYISIVLGSYIIFLFCLLTTGTIKKYINPRLSFLSVLALLMLIGMFISNLKKNFAIKPGHEHHCHCCAHKEEKLGKGSLILLLPLFLSMFIAPETLSYQPVQPVRISNPPVNNQPAQPTPVTWKPGEPEGKIAPSGYEEYTQLNIGDIIFDTLKPPKQKLVHSNIFLQGMVLHSVKLKADEMVVYRIVISCCAADGLPLGVLVKLPGKLDFKDEEWVGVEGTIQLLPFNEELKSIEPIAYMVPPEKIYPYFTATKAYKVAVPAEQYLFP